MESGRAHLSVMLIVPEAPAAVNWYRRALGADVLWDLGGVAGLELQGAPFFLDETNPANASEGDPGGFGDPFGHVWWVGDRSPLSPART